MLVLIYNRMFEFELNLDQMSFPPGIEFSEDRSRFRHADVVVFHLPSLPRIHFPRKRQGQRWVAWYMECEQHRRRMMSARFMRRFDLSMSYRQDADVMVTYIPDEIRHMTLPQNSVMTSNHEHLVCSFISGRADKSGRMKYLKELARHIEVHQFGRRGNRRIGKDLGFVSKQAISARYKFTLAFENAIAEDYVTEKLYEPLLAGSVPVYLGAPNVDQFAPVDACYINVEDFSSPASLAEYLLHLDNDEKAYHHLLNWRQRPRAEPFRAICHRSFASGLEGLAQTLAL